MSTAIVWMRRDLRLTDNPALTAAADRYERVVPVFIWSPDEDAPWQPGAAQRWWLHRSLESLAEQLTAIDSRLVVRRGPSLETLRSLAGETGAEAVLFNRLYEPAAAARDGETSQALQEDGLATDSFNGSLLFEPTAVETADGGPFRVFTPFWKACRGGGAPRAPEPSPERLAPPEEWPESLPLDELELLPDIAWYEEMQDTWQPGEGGAVARLETFLEEAVDRYADRRDYPGVEGVSRLSPHLHFGEISPHSVWAAVESRAAGGDGLPAQPLYRVRFRQHDAWPAYAGPEGDTLDVEIYEHWLHRAEDER